MSSVAGAIVKLLQAFGIKTPDGSNIQLGNKATYQTSYSLGQLDDEDLIPKRLAMGMTGTVVSILVPFTSATGIAIAWQTDVPEGQSDTYVNILGNVVPKPQVWVATGDVDNEYQQLPADAKVITSDDQTQVITLTFDWAITQTGFIVY